MSRLHILTLSWQGKDKLSTLYPSLANSLQSLNMDYVWHIRDNAASDQDGSKNLVDSWKDKSVNYIPINHNKDSYSVGMNFLFNQAKVENNDYILCLNNDVIFNNKTSIKNMIKILDDDSVGQVGAKLNYPDGRIQHYGVLFINKQNYPLPTNYCAGEKEVAMHKVNRLFPAITGALSLVKAETFKKVPFDPKFVWAFDDVVQSLTINYKLKKKIVCCADVDISHQESASLKKNPVNKLFMSQNLKNFLLGWGAQIIQQGDLDLSQKYRNLNFRVYK